MADSLCARTRSILDSSLFAVVAVFMGADLYRQHIGWQRNASVAQHRRHRFGRSVLSAHGCERFR